MVYMEVIEHNHNRLHLFRRPNFWSWCTLIGITIGALGVFYYSAGNLWEIICLLIALFWGVRAMDDWEECIFDKVKGQVTIQKKSLLQKFLPLMMKQSVVVANLDNIIDVRVEEKELKYLGKGRQVVLHLHTGAILGITESFTMENIFHHSTIANVIQRFLEPYISQTSQDDDDDYLGDSSSSEEDNFEQINH